MVTGHVVGAHGYRVAHVEGLALWQIAAAGLAGLGQREAALRQCLQLVARGNALLNQQGGQAGQGALVITGAHVVARLHAFNGVTVFVHVEHALFHRQ